jgi:hypothetical protein
MVCILASFDTASLYSVMNFCTTVTTLTMLSRGKLFTIWAGADRPALCHFGEVWTPGWSTVAGAAAAGWHGWLCWVWSALLCRASQRTHLEWCIWRRLFQYLAWVPSEFSSDASPPLRGCSLCSWMAVGFPLLPAYNCSKPVLKLPCPFPGNPCGGGRLHTTGSGEVACSLPRRGQTAGSCGIASAQSVTFLDSWSSTFIVQ